MVVWQIHLYYVDHHNVYKIGLKFINIIENTLTLPRSKVPKSAK